MEQKIKDIENGRQVYLNGTHRNKYATLRKIGSSMGFPIYVVEVYNCGIREHSWAYKTLGEAMETLTKGCYRFV